jgi:ABC-2 type transport system ATP-binding protein
MTLAIEINRLSKSFGRGKKAFKAVDQLSFQVEAGTVYGFLGANGAGKSTTIRMLLGLTSPDSGTAALFGQAVQTSHETLRTRVGALVEGASLYPFMTGRQNLEILARTSGCYDPKGIQSLLERLDMADRADRKAKGYSTGMKQRIGIAAALLNNPDLVILDEPTNGLDPRGIQDIRTLVRQLAEEEGKTVFLSSHMLHEVEQMCDRVAIIAAGRLVRDGAVKDLLNEQTRIVVEASPLQSAHAVVALHFEATMENDQLLIQGNRNDIPDIVRLLTNAQIDVFAVQQQNASLEEYFLTVTEQPAQELAHA